VGLITFDERGSKQSKPLQLDTFHKSKSNATGAGLSGTSQILPLVWQRYTQETGPPGVGSV